MKFWEAMKALQEGRKVRCVSWQKDAHVYDKPISCWWCDQAEIGQEWEFYDDPPQLPFQEVVKGLMKGKRFRRLAWKDNIGIEVVIEKDTETWIRSWNGRETTYFRVEDLEATDWVEVKDDLC